MAPIHFNRTSLEVSYCPTTSFRHKAKRGRPKIMCLDVVDKITLVQNYEKKPQDPLCSSLGDPDSEKSRKCEKRKYMYCIVMIKHMQMKVGTWPPS